MTPTAACACVLAIASLPALAETKLLQGFEGDGFDDWKVEGDAFGLAPIAGTCEELTSPITGYANGSLACSAHGGDEATGVLTSQEFPLSENHLAFLIAGGKHPG